LGAENPAATKAGGGNSEPGLDSFSQTNKPIGGLGEALQSGNRLSAANTPFPSRWASIVLITTGSSPRVPTPLVALRCRAANKDVTLGEARKR